MEFKDLVGKEKPFYGVDMNEFKLGDVIFEAIEDEEDGYRSCLESVEVKDSEGIFFREPLATVIIEEFDNGYTDGYRLKDIKDNHIWLEFGTENYDDYYPCFVFEYKPKEPIDKE